VWIYLAFNYMATNKDPILNKLAARIEYLRKQKGLTQEQLAHEAKLHRAYFWDIENGRNISVLTAHKVAKALGVSLSQLFDI
jgi:transcriptional regulator with XRE-family HTH domain